MEDKKYATDSGNFYSSYSYRLITPSKCVGKLFSYVGKTLFLFIFTDGIMLKSNKK